MKNIFCCLLLLLCTPVLAETNNAKLVSDCIIKRSTPNERFTVFKYAVEGNVERAINQNKVGHLKSIGESETLSPEIRNLLQNMVFRCEEKLDTLTPEEAEIMGEILTNTIMLDVVNNPKVQELYK